MTRRSPPSLFVLLRRSFTSKQLFVLLVACLLVFIFGKMTWKEYKQQAAFEDEGVQTRAKVTGRRVQKSKKNNFYYLGIQFRPDNRLPVTVELTVDKSVYRAHPKSSLLAVEYLRSEPQNVRLPAGSDYRRFGIIVVGLVAAVVLAILLLAMYRALRMRRIYTNGVAAQGKVTKLLGLGKIVEQSSSLPGDKDEHETWQMYVSFADDKGRKHHGAAPGTVNKSTRRPVGAEVTVYYDANDPKRFVVGADHAGRATARRS